MPAKPSSSSVESSTDPTDEELNDDHSNDAEVEEAMAGAPGATELADIVQANQENLYRSLQALDAAAMSEITANNYTDAAQAISQNGYVSVPPALVIASNDGPGAGGSPNSPYGKWNQLGTRAVFVAAGPRGQYDAAELQPIVPSGKVYEEMFEPFGGAEGASTTTTNPDRQVSAAADAEAQAAILDSSQQDLASPPYAQAKQRACIRLTTGLVAGMASLGALLATGIGLAVYFSRTWQAASEAQDDSTGSGAGGGSGGDPPPAVPPAIPGGLQATPESPTAIMIGWVANIDAITTGYVVKRNGVEIARNGAANFSFLDTGLIASTQYCYTVAAIYQGGVTDDSAKVCATTAAVAPAVPATPQNLSGLSEDPNSIRFSWDASVGATAYLVKRRLTTDTNFVLIATVPATGILMSYDDTGLQEGTDYAYTVAAQNAAGTSADATFLVVRTKDLLDAQLKLQIQQWNQLGEDVFWGQVIAWITSANPSFDLQYNVAQFALGLAVVPAEPVFNTEALIQEQVDALVAAFTASNNNTLTIYNTLQTLTVGRGQPVARYEKLNILSRVLAHLLIILP